MSDTNRDPDDLKAGTMAFMDHLEELRVRLVRFLVVAVLCILACYAFRKDILNYVRKPVDEPLKKYTSTVKAPQGKGIEKYRALGDYDCDCKPDIVEKKATVVPEPEVETETKTKTKTKEVVEASADASADESGLELVEKGINYIKETFNDFLVFYQVMTGRDPTPITDMESVKGQSEPSVSGNQDGLPDTFNLSCQCKIKDDKKEPEHSTMVYIGLPELFFAQMKVAIFSGFFFAFPYFLIELWGFVGPALYRSEKKVFWIFALCSYLFFIGGAIFGYFVVFPFGFDFFLSLSQPGEIMPSLSIGEYLNLTIKLLFAFGCIFELPLVVFILARLGIVTPIMMIKNVRIAVLVVFIISAMLTPPDPLTMMLMAGPLISLYLISIVVCFFGLNKKKAAIRRQGLDPDEFES